VSACHRLSAQTIGGQVKHESDKKVYLMNLRKIIIICGPTGVGKSSLAIELAKRCNGEIINADSQQVYRDLDIGTAKIKFNETQGIPHHLIDIVTPDKHFDANNFVDLADKAILEISGKNKLSFIIGGTGLYLKMLINGICDAPPQSPDLRKKYQEIINTTGLRKLYNHLCKIDQTSAKFIHPNDKTRIVRALEIYELSGKTASKFYNDHNFINKRYDSLKLGINIPRKDLYDKIDNRVDIMLKNGWVDEVKKLLVTYPSSAKAFSAIGYREIIRFINNKIPYDKMVSLIKRNSRHYAKRQLTWFMSDKEISWFHPDETDKIEKEILSFLKH